MMPVSPFVPAVSSVPSHLVPASLALPLVGMQVTVDACNGLARTVVRQEFTNPHRVPLSVSYTFPLPADGAVSGYSFIIGNRRIVGEVAPRKEARERFENAILEGRSAALLEQERTSLFTQELGNIPPGVSVTAELIVDQKLRWLDEGSWEWRFPTAAAPRYLGTPGAVTDADRVSITVADSSLAAKVDLALEIRDPFKNGVVVESPSHPIAIVAHADRQSISLGQAGGASLDRDLVVRWRVAAARPGFTVDLGRAPESSVLSQDAYAICTVVPPLSAHQSTVPRDVIVLLDTSGSMAGEPLAQARRIVSAVIDTMTERDQLELIEFSNQARRWKREAVPATAANRADALLWLAGLRASGGTEMRTGISEAMATLRGESQRQILLVTDGQIGFEAQVVSEIASGLPRGARLHTVGVGSAVNRSLTGPAARVGRGVEVIVGLGEDPERAAQRVVARTNAPLVVDLSLEGSALQDHAPALLPDLFAGSPLLISARVREEGGELKVRGRTVNGPWEAVVVLPRLAKGAGNAAVLPLYGRERVEDLDVSLRGEGEKDREVERLGVAFSIATRMTSWVAVSDRMEVDPRDPLRRERVPQALPYGMSAAGLGLRAARPGSGSVETRSAGELGSRAASRTRSVPATGSVFAPPPQAPSPRMAAARPAAPASMPARPHSVIVRGGGGATQRPPAAVQETATRSSATPLRGRCIMWRDGTYVVEIAALEAALSWDPGAVSHVLVTSPGGERVIASLDLSRTTRAATLNPGEVFRIALVFERVVAEQIVALELVLGGIHITVAVQP